MVLQSFLQYRAFTNDEFVKHYADNHHEKLRVASRISQGNTAGVQDGVTSPVASTVTAHSTPDRELPGNIVGEEVETHLREKAEAEPKLIKTKTSEEEDVFLVTWDPKEDTNPMNWSWGKKWFLIGMITSIALLVGAGASVDSAAIGVAAEYFHVSEEVMSLQVGVFLVGFGISAPFLGALSEVGGRNPVYSFTLLLFLLFQIGSALATNIQTRVILRFFAGLAGSTPLSNAGGSLADVVNARQRTFVFPIFACSGFMGPTLGPVIGGYLAMKMGQAWCEWIVAIWAAATFVVVVLFMPETYGPVLLKMKAAHVRAATGDDRYKSALEREREVIPFKKHFKHVLALPFLYLIYEPIVLFFSLYMTVVYIILFGDLTAYPLIFEPFGFNTGEQGLAFIPIAIGLFLTLGLVPLSYSRYLKVTEKVREKKRLDGDKNWEKAEPPPEERLILAMFGTFLVPIGLFYQAWTSFPSISPWPCLTAGIIFGAGILTCFISSYSYCIDVYKAGSATALGSLTFVRYIVSGGAVMFTAPMYKSLGNQWALSLLAFISLACCAIPWVFYIYGHHIREWSRYVPAHD